MGNRARGEGSINQIFKDGKPTGKWSARIMIGYKENGNPKIKTFAGNTRKEVADRLDKFKSQMKMGVHETRLPDFDEYITTWLNNVKYNDRILFRLQFLLPQQSF